MTVFDLIEMLREQMGWEEKTSSPLPSFLEYGRRRGWLEDLDEEGKELALERRTMARILHQFLKLELGERDETDWRGADKLKDLYDCHTCVNHIAQVYAKGIMETDKSQVFGVREEVSLEEAETAVARALGKQKRKPPFLTEAADEQRDYEGKLTFREAMNKMDSLEHYSLVDVRTHREFERDGLPNAICIPLIQLLQNGERLDRLSEPLFFACDYGVQSQIAATFAKERGYARVFYLALREGDEKMESAN